MLKMHQENKRNEGDKKKCEKFKPNIFKSRLLKVPRASSQDGPHSTSGQFSFFFSFPDPEEKSRGVALFSVFKLVVHSIDPVS